MKTKPFWNIAGCVVSAVALILSLSTCDMEARRASYHIHAWSFAGYDVDPTCSAEGSYCFTCNLFQDGNDECSYDDPNVSTGKSAKIIQKAIPIDPDAHHPDSTVWARTTEPTCTENGIDTGTCDDCKKSFTRSVAAAHSGEWKVTKPPTCTVQGTRERICTVCGETETVSLFEPHHWIDTEIIRAPTCIWQGERGQRCTTCGQTGKTGIRSLGHNWEKRPTGMQCTRCGVWSLISGR